MPRILTATAFLLIAVTACASTQEQGVTFEIDGIVAVSSSGPNAGDANYFFDRIVTGDLDGGLLDQYLALYGREDLITGGHAQEYTPSTCQLSEDRGNPLDVIEELARSHQIVIVNESHVRSGTRGTILDIAERLAPLGFDVFAAETFSHRFDETSGGENDSFRRRFGGPRQDTYKDTDGYYTSEAMFGRLVRRAQATGYRLVPYEQKFDPQAERPEDFVERVSLREEAQANNLIANILDEEPDARILIHVGYNHVFDEPIAWEDGREVFWMAAGLKAKTGIDPLTIDQTTCIGNGEGDMLRLADHPMDAADIAIDRPITSFVRGRPSFRLTHGDIPTAIPVELMPSEGWHIIEAWREDQDAEEVPMDRVAVRPEDQDIALMLPPGHYRLRAVKP